MLCYNCDVGSAQFKCVHCPESECLFCSECRGLHTKIKAYRTHQFAALPKKSIICTNCESSESKYICRECDDSSKYMCVGCSLIHPKIKAFRNHNVIPIDGASTSPSTSTIPPLTFTTDGLSRVAVYWIDVAYYNMSSRPWTDIILWQTFAACLVVSMIYYTIVNTIFRKYAPLVNIAMAIGLYQWLQSDQFKVSEADRTKLDGRKKVAPSLAGLSQKLNNMGGIFGSAPGVRIPTSWNTLDADINPEDFKDEFWYSTEGKKASMRPRTRPYKGRRTALSNHADESTSPAKGSSADTVE